MKLNRHNQNRFIPDVSHLERRATVSTLLLNALEPARLARAACVVAPDTSPKGSIGIERGAGLQVWIADTDTGRSTGNQSVRTTAGDAAAYHTDAGVAAPPSTRSAIVLTTSFDSELGSSLLALPVGLSESPAFYDAGASLRAPATQPVEAGSTAGLPSSATPPAKSSAIRPMMMSPIPQGTSALDPDAPPATINTTLSGGDPAPPPDRPPTITLSGGDVGAVQKKDANNQPIPGEYEASHAAPVGTVAHFKAYAPAGSTYVVDTWAWSQGSNYANYFATPANQSPPASQAAPSMPVKNQQEYDFIVDPDTQTYNVTVSVHYTNGASGTAHCSLPVVEPSSSIQQTQRGTQVADGMVNPSPSPGV